MIDWTEIEGIDFAEDVITPDEIKETLDAIWWLDGPHGHVALMSYEQKVVLLSAAVGYGMRLEADGD